MYLLTQTHFHVLNIPGLKTPYHPCPFRDCQIAGIFQVLILLPGIGWIIQGNTKTKNTGRGIMLRVYSGLKHGR
jgi:hypothetical protein